MFRRLVPTIACLCLLPALPACGGSGDDALPQLSAATGADLLSCTELFPIPPQS